MDDSGFKDIDGYSENDLYGCGYTGEIMHYDGKHWSKLNTPTKETLNAICCAEDGQVYVAGNHGVLLKGRGDQWVQIEQDTCTSSLDNIVWYKDRVYVASWVGLYELVDEQLKEVNPGPGIPPFYYGKGLSARDGILVTAGHSSALQFDGETWTVLVGRQSDAELMDNINSMEALINALDNTRDKMEDLKEAIKKAEE